MHSILCSQKFSNRLCFRKQAVVYKTKGHQTLNIAFILITLLPDFFNRPACFYSPFRSPLQHPTLDPTFLDLFKSAPIKIYSYFLAPFSCYSFPGNTLFANSLLCLILYSQILPFYDSLYLRTNGPGLSNFIAYRSWNFSGSYEKQPFLYFARYGFPSYRNR